MFTLHRHDPWRNGRLGRQRSEATPICKNSRRSISKIVILSEARHWRSQWPAHSKDPYQRGRAPPRGEFRPEIPHPFQYRKNQVPARDSAERRPTPVATPSHVMQPSRAVVTLQAPGHEETLHTTEALSP
jgi:hypothetical protein